MEKNPLHPAPYDLTLVAIDHAGRWHRGSPELPPEASVSGEMVNLPAAPGDHTLLPMETGDVASASDLDVILPIVHGRGGEDGALQGLLELAGVPYVGSGVLGSALQMDKEVAKRLLREAGLPVLPWVPVRSAELAGDAAAVEQRVLREIGLPAFVKPANGGSSVGTSRVDEASALLPALREATRYDTKVLVERAVEAREIEVAVLGNGPFEASLPGEIRTKHAFYDYEAKDVDEETELLVPAPVSEQHSRELQRLAVAAMRTLEGSGLGRVDFLMDTATGDFYVSEVNSLPGFTDASMFPRLWEATGLPYPALLDRLIDLALERHRERAALETLYRRT
jgi:D-alanine-D-alanine ligase